MQRHHHFALVVVLAAVLPLVGCANLGARDPVEAYVVGVEPLQGAGLEVRMLVKIRVQNPNDTQIDFNGVAVNMDVQGKRFATGVSDTGGTIPRFGESVVEVPVSISAFRLVRGAMDAFGAERTGKIEYELRGKLAGTAFNTVRFNSRGQMELPAGVYGNEGRAN